MWNACRPKSTFFSTKESRIFRGRKRLHEREGGHVITVISDCGEAVVYQIRASVPFLIVPLLRLNDALKRTKRVRFPISIFETFRSARGSLDRVSLSLPSRGKVYHHAKGKKGVKIGYRIEQKQNERWRIEFIIEEKSEKEYSRRSCKRTCA